MERHFDVQLDQLKKRILTMGGNVERAIFEATQALIKRDIHGFKVVHDIERRINDDHIQIDDACVQFLAQQAPVAKDLRFIMSIIKINTDLERMGDQASNIAHNGQHYLTCTPVKELVDTPRMAETVRGMVKAALDSFVRGDLALAKGVLETDDIVDELKDKIFRDLIQYMSLHPENIEAAMDLVLIARNLERLGDHATNIAEDVIYAFSGRDVRHGNSPENPKSK